MKPSIPKGTRDFSPDEMVKRNYIFDTIKSVYQRYGYMPLETPAMENLSTLMGKYGEEGDKLLFKILDSGEYLNHIPGNVREQKILSEDDIKEIRSLNLLEFTKEMNEIISKFTFKDLIANQNEFTKSISEKGLRYDLTVPFARYVVMHQNEITFPFKRYQIQPVWRADRPQKGRYREFYQCDADVIGSTSLLNEIELIQIIDDVFSKFGLKVLIQINNRKILSGIAEYIGETEKIIDITVAIDKLDKIGIEKVNEELRSKGLSEKAIEQLQPIINLTGTTNDKVQQLKTILANSVIGLKGIEEVEFMFDQLSNFHLPSSSIELELTLARGLNYYTGAIIEVKVNDERPDFRSSILGGGRYDDLTGIFGLPNVSGVGISFGADRIYDVMEELKLFPESAAATTKILFVNFGKEEEKYCLQLIRKVRDVGINAELYPESAKMKKQMSYADAKKIPFVALIGEEEMKTGMITLKNMTTGEQEKLSIENLIVKLL